MDPDRLLMKPEGLYPFATVLVVVYFHKRTDLRGWRKLSPWAWKRRVTAGVTTTALLGFAEFFGLTEGARHLQEELGVAYRIYRNFDTSEDDRKTRMVRYLCSRMEWPTPSDPGKEPAGDNADQYPPLVTDPGNSGQGDQPVDTQERETAPEESL